MGKRPAEHVNAQRQIKEIQANVCIICWDTDGRKKHGHHLIYYSCDGSSGRANFITVCDNCHEKIHKGELNVDISSF